MRVEETISEVIGPCLVDVDRRLARCMGSVVEAVVVTKRLSLTALGRSLRSSAKPKHSIKRVDRLLGNASVHESIDGTYRAISARALGTAKEATVLVDWTDSECHGFVVLSATLATQSGRAIVIRHEVYPLAQLHNGSKERRFVRRLHDQLPPDIRVTVVADAGFGVPFYRAVRRVGWHFVGRLTRQVYVGSNPASMKRVDQSLFPRARSRPRSMGACLVTATHRFPAHVVLVKQKPKRRHGSPHRTRKGSHPGAPAFKKHQRRGTDPWVLFTSLHSASAEQVVAIYKLRMQIEQCFRDAKSQRFGLALEHIRSRQPDRIAVLLLIAALATFVATIVGAAAETKKLHKAFQANTLTRRVLSRVFLGLAVMAIRPNALSRVAIASAARRLTQEIASASSDVGIL